MTIFPRDIVPDEPVSADNVALAIAAEDVILAIATILTGWRDDPAQETAEMAREFIDLINTWTKRQVIEAYSAGVISEAEGDRIFRENGLRFL